LIKFVRLRAVRWLVAAGVAVVLVVAGLQGVGVQAASAASSRPASPAVRAARAAVTPGVAAARAAASVPAARKAELAAATALAAARGSGQAAEVAADRTAYSQTFANPNGSFTTTMSVQPRWVKSGSSWVSADADLVKQPDGSYAPKATLGGLSLSGGGSDVLATEGTGSKQLSVTWPGTLPAPDVSGAQAAYAGVFPGVNLVVTANLEGGFSETLVITDKAAAADSQLKDLNLGVSASAGLTAHAGSNGSLAEEDSSGKPVFSSPAPLAWDSRSPGASAAGPGQTGAGVLQAPASYSAGSVRLGVPASLLADPAADFPVYVDPSYNESAWWEDWGDDQSAYPTLNDQDDIPDGQVAVGYNGGVERGEYVFGPPTAADSAPVTITSATLTAEAVAAGTSASTSHTINVYSTSEYTTSTTWDNPPTVLAGPAAATFTTTSATPDQNVSWNVTSFLQTAYEDNPWELSLQLQNADETDSGPFVAFGENATLSFTYTQPAPSIPVGTGPVPNATFLSFPISDKVNLKVNVGSGDALLTTSDLTVPEIGGNLTLGAAYNSLLTGTVTGGAEGSGFRQQGVDTRLYLGAGTGSGTASGSITYLGADGLSGVFTPPASGSTYTSPAGLHATLTSAPASPCGGSAYELTWHSGGEMMCFNGSGMLTSQVDRDGNTTAFTYTYGLETGVSYTPAGASSPTETVTASSSYPDLDGLSESGGASGTKNVTYNINGNYQVLSVQQADGTTVSFGYDSNGNLNSVTNGAGAVTTLVYNSARQVTSVTQPYGSGSATATTRFSYVSATETQVAAPNTNQSDAVSAVPNTTYTINSQALVTATKDPAGHTTNTGYNSATNNVASTENQLAGTTTDTWGSNSGESLTKTTSPTGASQSYAYGNSATGADPTAAYLPSSSTDAQNNKTAYTYNGPGNQLSSDDALAATAQVTDNSDGTVATSTTPAPDSAVTSYAYNSLHQLTKVTPPTSGSLKPITLTYDGFGRVSTVTNGDGDTVTYTYDLADRVTKEAYTGPQAAVTVTYAYDGAGNLKTQTDSSGTTNWTFDGRSQVLTKAATSGGGTLAYTYDADGNLITAHDAGGTTTYTYNPLDQLTSLTDEAGDLWEFAYNPAGERTTTWFDTTTTESTWAEKEAISYDTGGRITRITTTRDSASPATVSDVSYCYSKYVSGTACPTAAATTDTSLLLYSTNNQTGTVSQYTYDAGNRLKSVTNDNGATYAYTYNGDGDILTGANRGTETYNGSDQLTYTGYTYDGAGQMITTPSSSDKLTYNDAGQWTGATSTVGTESFTYAGSSQDQVLSDGSATGITYGLAGQDGQPAMQSYAPAGSATDYVIRDQQGDPLGYVASGTGYAFAVNNIGSVTNVINPAGTTVASYGYDPYGHGSAPTGPDAADNLIGYEGLLDNDSNFLSLGDRWYNPVTDDFTSQDPDTFLNNPANGNRYAYAADNPANNIDPTGAGACDVAGLLLGVDATVLTGVLGILFPPLGAALIIGGVAADVLIGGSAFACDQVFNQ
jgi:RHS repeat-associated protein